jgi:hypothetical protein
MIEEYSSYYRRGAMKLGLDTYSRASRRKCLINLDLVP